MSTAKINQFFSVLALGFFSLTAQADSKHSHATGGGGVHEHGKGEIHIAIDNGWTKGEIEMHLPAIDLLGFERAPKGAEEKAKVDALLKQLNTVALTSFSFPANANCKTTLDDGADLEIEGAHAEIHVDLEFVCTQSLQNSHAEFVFSEPFSKLKHFHVQVISQSAQTSKDIKKSSAKILFK